MATVADLLFELKKVDGGLNISIFTPSGLSIPSHFHITEIGRTTKNFVDCGGTRRSDSHTSFQVWVANDKDHRLTVDKFIKIIEAGSDLVEEGDQAIFEYDSGHSISLYGIEMIQTLESIVNIFLSKTTTNCLAQDKCGINLNKIESCSGKGCC